MAKKVSSQKGIQWMEARKNTAGEGTDFLSPTDDRAVSLTLQPLHQSLIHPLSHRLWLAFWLGHTIDVELEAPLTKCPLKDFRSPFFPTAPVQWHSSLAPLFTLR